MCNRITHSEASSSTGLVIDGTFCDHKSRFLPERFYLKVSTAGWIASRPRLADKHFEELVVFRDVNFSAIPK